jgi:hypothetical protein
MLLLSEKEEKKKPKKRIINIGDFAHFAHWKPTLEARGKEPARRPTFCFQHAPKWVAGMARIIAL